MALTHSGLFPQAGIHQKRTEWLKEGGEEGDKLQQLKLEEDQKV